MLKPSRDSPTASDQLRRCAGTHAGIVPPVKKAVRAVSLRIIEPSPHLVVLAACRRVASERGSRPGAVMSLQAQPVVRTTSAQLQEPVRKFATVANPAGTVGRLPEAVHCHELLTRILPPLGQLAGARIGCGCVGCAETLCREQRQAASQLQFDLPPLPSRTLGRSKARRRFHKCIEHGL
jgi:hypothetical protein